MKYKPLLCSLLLSGSAFAANLPYDEAANAKADIQHALATARQARRPVLVIFGANWCEDCRALDASLKSEPSASLIAKSFEVVKVDVGNFDHNVDISDAYGGTTRKGIPSAIVLDADNHILYATRAGELANARTMSKTGVYDFFTAMVKQSRAR
jgi:thioredoxin 1